MDTHQQLLKKFESCTQQGKKKSGQLCSAAVISLWLNGAELETVDTAIRELFFLEIQTATKRAEVSNTFSKYLLDSLHRTLFNVGIYRSSKKPPLMSPIVARNARLISGVYKREIDRLSIQNNVLSANEHLDSLIFYAVFESGLCFEEGIEALQNAVLTNPKFLTSVGGDTYINLHYRRSNHEHNRRREGISYTERKLYLGPLTLFSVIGFLKAKPLLCIEQPAIQRLRHKIATHLPNSTMDEVNTTLLLRGVAMSISQRPGTQMPSFLMHYASGSVSSASTFDSSLLAMYTEQFYLENETKQEQRATLPQLRKSSLKKKELPAYNRIINHSLRELFKQSHTAPRIPEVCRREVISALKDFKQRIKNTLSEPEHMLLEWLLNQFTHGKLRKFGSGARYLSAMGTIWLHLTDHIAISALEPEELDELYSELQSMGKNSDSSFPDMLDDLMRYLHVSHDIELPTALQKADEEKSLFVRSSIPSAAHLEQLFVDIDRIYSDTSEHVRDSVLAMLIIMMRMGLRPHEVANLEIKDAILNGTGTIFVRRNPHYKPKTASSPRQIQIDPLLKKVEREFLRRFIRRRQDEVSDVKYRQVKSALLFTMVPGRNYQFDMREVSTHVTALLSRYSGVRTPLYQLRHYALSIFQLICFASNQRALQFSSYTAEEVGTIKEYFQPSDSFNVLHKIASVSGHLTPKTALSTYCHFTDMLLHEATLRADISITFPVIQKLSRIQSAKLRKLADQTQVQIQRMTNPELLKLAKYALQQERSRWTTNLKPKCSKGV